MDDYPELVSEGKHLDNLLFVRELEKLNVDNWVEEKKNGGLVDDDYVLEHIENLALIDECITKLYTEVKYFDKKRDADIPYYLTPKYKYLNKFYNK